MPDRPSPQPRALARPARATRDTVFTELLDALPGPPPSVSTAVNAGRGTFDPVAPWPLGDLPTGDPGDPTLTVLDAWSVIAEVLSFYSERIAAEGYLASATEPESVAALAASVGYPPRPGVAASGYLALLIDDVPGAGPSTVLPAGTQAQSIPGPGELPQVFETTTALTGRAEWNTLPPRLTLPPTLTADADGIWVRGTTTRVQPGYTVVVRPTTGAAAVRLVTAVAPDATADRTLVSLQHTGDRSNTSPAMPQPVPPSMTGDLSPVVDALQKPPSTPPATVSALQADLKDLLAPTSDLRPRLLTALRPALAESLSEALAGLEPVPAKASLTAFRATTQLFGASAPLRPTYDHGQLTGFIEWDRESTVPIPETTVLLDSRVSGVLPGSDVVLESAGSDPFLTQVTRVDAVAKVGYGRAAQVTRLTLAAPWTPPAGGTLTEIRGVTVHLLAEDLQLAEVPTVPDVGDPKTATVAGTTIALDGLFSGLTPGRLVIVHGERTDVPGVAGLEAGEVAMIAGVSNAASSPADHVHTTLQLAGQLAYRYRPDAVEIYGNVAPVTAGASRSDVLGIGNGGQSRLSFPLPQSPLTYVPGTTGGAQNTLTVYVDGVAWRESDTLTTLGPTDTAYLLATDAAGASTVVFGNGRNGAPVPTGATVSANYRTGLGAAGNVRPGQLSQLLSRPLGLRAATNPLPASGGADREDSANVRRNAAAAILAGGRLVSVRDYEDFSRTHPGIGKSLARQLSNGSEDVVFLTVTGVDSAALDEASSQLTTLRAALRRAGDSALPVMVTPRRLTLLVISLRLRLLPGFEWDRTEGQVRAALLGAFGFPARELAEDVVLGDVITTAQEVAGVDEVFVSAMCGLPEPVTADPRAAFEPSLSLRVTAGVPRLEAGQLHPAGLVVLSPELPDTLIIEEAP